MTTRTDSLSSCQQQAELQIRYQTGSDPVQFQFLNRFHIELHRCRSSPPPEGALQAKRLAEGPSGFCWFCAAAESTEARSWFCSSDRSRTLQLSDSACSPALMESWALSSAGPAEQVGLDPSCEEVQLPDPVLGSEDECFPDSHAGADWVGPERHTMLWLVAESEWAGVDPVRPGPVPRADEVERLLFRLRTKSLQNPGCLLGSGSSQIQIRTSSAASLRG